MDLTRPARTVVPSLTADVLVVLAGTSRPLGAREVHRLVEGASWGGVRKVLTHLADTGLANVAEAGNATLYTLNREHVAAEAVLALVDLRARLFDRMRAAMRDWSRPPVSAVIFGSAARGDGHLGSDIDVLVVRPSDVRADDPQWSGDVTTLGASIGRWSGNPASILDVTEALVANQEGQPTGLPSQEPNIHRRHRIADRLQRGRARRQLRGALGRMRVLHLLVPAPAWVCISLAERERRPVV